MLKEAFKVQLNGFSDQAQNFLSCIRNGHASGQIGHMRSKRRRSLLNDDRVFHAIHLTSVRLA
jgi:hypothetical protein